MFIPLWQDCKFRQQTLVRHDEGCRCAKVVMICGDEQHDSYQKPLALHMCEACFLDEATAGVHLRDIT